MTNDPKLPDAELEVLACLHRLRTATAREVREQLAGFRPMAHGSVMTLLGRLEAKGLVRRRKGPSGKAFVYEPTRDRRQTMRPLLNEWVRRIFGGDPLALVHSLLESRPPTREELDRLETMVRELRKGKRKEGGR